MASDREIHRISRDVEAARTLAKSLLAYRDIQSDWEIDFLEETSVWKGEQLTYRHAEKLLQVRDDYMLISEWRKLSISKIIQQSREARVDLKDELDADFLETLKGSFSIRRKFLGRLMRCAIELGVVERYMWSEGPSRGP